MGHMDDQDPEMINVKPLEERFDHYLKTIKPVTMQKPPIPSVRQSNPLSILERKDSVSYDPRKDNIRRGMVSPSDQNSESSNYYARFHFNEDTPVS